MFDVFEIIPGKLYGSARPNWNTSQKEFTSHLHSLGVGCIVSLQEATPKKEIVKGSPLLDLNSIPMPDYSLVEGMSRNPKVVSVVTSRGCPFNCKFCSLKAMFGRQYRPVSTKRIIDYLSRFKNLKTLCFDEPMELSI